MSLPGPVTVAAVSDTVRRQDTQESQVASVPHRTTTRRGGYSGPPSRNETPLQEGEGVAPERHSIKVHDPTCDPGSLASPTEPPKDRTRALPSVTCNLKAVTQKKPADVSGGASESKVSHEIISLLSDLVSFILYRDLLLFLYRHLSVTSLLGHKGALFRMRQMHDPAKFRGIQG